MDTPLGCAWLCYELERLQTSTVESVVDITDEEFSDEDAEEEEGEDSKTISSTATKRKRAMVLPVLTQRRKMRKMECNRV